MAKSNQAVTHNPETTNPETSEKLIAVEDDNVVDIRKMAKTVNKDLDKDRKRLGKKKLRKLGKEFIKRKPEDSPFNQLVLAAASEFEFNDDELREISACNRAVIELAQKKGLSLQEYTPEDDDDDFSVTWGDIAKVAVGAAVGAAVGYGMYSYMTSGDDDGGETIDIS